MNDKTDTATTDDTASHHTDCPMTYTITTTIAAPFEDVLTTVKTTLQDEGFGVLTDIDVQATLKEKIEVDTERYRILGACNPPLAHEGLTADPDLGALLPCNVAIYEQADGDVVVSAVNPEQLVGIADNPELDTIGTAVLDSFERVLAEVDHQFGTVGQKK